MEFPQLGEQCSVNTCNRLDFLPVKCDACDGIFCSDHMTYNSHKCYSARKKDVQVPVCPLCNSPVPSNKAMLPDVAVGRHIDNDCKSDQRKVFTNRCSMTGCRVKEIVPIVCSECGRNYCLRHRHSADHVCRKQDRGQQTNKVQNSVRSSFTKFQGSMSEDEALARALQLSLNESATAMARQTVEMRPRSSDNCHIS